MQRARRSVFYTSISGVVTSNTGTPVEKKVIVPLRRELARETLSAILRQARITVNEFAASLLRELFGSQTVVWRYADAELSTRREDNSVLIV